MNEEIELEEGQKPYVSHSRGGVGRSAEANVLNSKGETSKTFTKKEHGPDYRKKANAHLKKNYNKLMGEEAPANVVGGGKVASVGVGPQGEPGMTAKAIRRYKRKNKEQTPRKIKGFADFSRE